MPAAYVLIGCLALAAVGIGVKDVGHAVKHAAVSVYHKVHHPPKPKE